MLDDNSYERAVRVRTLSDGRRIGRCTQCFAVLFAYRSDEYALALSSIAERTIVERHQRECARHLCPSCGAARAAPGPHVNPKLSADGFLCDDPFHDTLRVVRVPSE